MGDAEHTAQTPYLFDGESYMASVESLTTEELCADEASFRPDIGKTCVMKLPIW